MVVQDLSLYFLSIRLHRVKKLQNNKKKVLLVHGDDLKNEIICITYKRLQSSDVMTALLIYLKAIFFRHAPANNTFLSIKMQSLLIIISSRHWHCVLRKYICCASSFIDMQLTQCTLSIRIWISLFTKCSTASVFWKQNKTKLIEKKVRI